MKDSFCPNCSTHLLIDDKSLSSKRLKCPNCKLTFDNPHYCSDFSTLEEISHNDWNKYDESDLNYKKSHEPKRDNTTKTYKALSSNNTKTAISLTKNGWRALTGLIVTVIIILIIFSPRDSDNIYVLNRNTYGVKTLSDFRLLERYYNGDSQALVNLNARGRTTILLEGLEVELLESGSSYAVVQITDGHWRGETYYLRRRDISRKR